MVEKNAQSLHRLTALISQNKRHSQIPEKLLNVDASLGKRGELGG